MLNSADLERATARELIVAAQESICSTDDPAKRWQITFAIAKIAKEVRAEYRQENDAPGRAELRSTLERVASLSRKLRKLIEDPYVNKALGFGWAPLADGAINLCALRDLDGVRRSREETPDLLEVLESSSAVAVKELALEGRIGDVGTWWRINLPAKIQLAVFGVQLFKVANGTSKSPSRNNDSFKNFLQYVWVVATRDLDSQDPSSQSRDEDWGNPIREARASKKTGQEVLSPLLRREAGRGNYKLGLSLHRGSPFPWFLMNRDLSDQS